MKVDPYVQERVASTNGRLYMPLVNRLARYPIPKCPLPPVDGGLLLDVGCGWGRWMVAAGRAGYRPVGIDVQLEAVLAARRVLEAHGIQGYVVVADLGRLPFRSGVFDVAFSYSAIQHTHRERARSCVTEVHRVLCDGGSCMLEFPTRCGLGRLLRLGWRRDPEEDDPASWCVRYYSVKELERLFVSIFGECELRADCYLGIGVQPADLDILPWWAKSVVFASEGLKGGARLLPPLRRLADSVYVVARKSGAGHGAPPGDVSAIEFPAAGGRPRTDNLAVTELLACPVTGGPLTLESARGELVSRRAGLAFPVVDGVPVMLVERARGL